MLSSSARGSGEARGEPGGGPGATAVSGHRLSTTRTRRQTQFMSPQGQGFPRAGGREPGAFNPSLSAAGGAPGVSWAAAWGGEQLRRQEEAERRWAERDTDRRGWRQPIRGAAGGTGQTGPREGARRGDRAGAGTEGLVPGGREPPSAQAPESPRGPGDADSLGSRQRGSGGKLRQGPRRPEQAREQQPQAGGGERLGAGGERGEPGRCGRRTHRQTDGWQGQGAGRGCARRGRPGSADWLASGRVGGAAGVGCGERVLDPLAPRRQVSHSRGPAGPVALPLSAQVRCGPASCGPPGGAPGRASKGSPVGEVRVSGAPSWPLAPSLAPSQLGLPRPGEGAGSGLCLPPHAPPRGPDSGVRGRTGDARPVYPPRAASAPTGGAARAREGEGSPPGPATCPRAFHPGT